VIEAYHAWFLDFGHRTLLLRSVSRPLTRNDNAALSGGRRSDVQVRLRVF
jgi:hypothetical protein